MVYIKAAAAGIVGALLAGAAWTWAAIQIPIWWQMCQQRGQGGGIGASWVGSDSILLAALVGFVIGFVRFAKRTA
jgi:hypothetical protein